MRGIEHHRIAKGAHNRRGTHIRHQVVIAKGGAAFCEEQTLIASARELLRTCCISHGARNCPFLTFTGFPVLAAARRRSVWRQRNAGIWMMSRTSVAAVTCSTPCTSDKTALDLAHALQNG